MENDAWKWTCHNETKYREYYIDCVNIIEISKVKYWREYLKCLLKKEIQVFDFAVGLLCGVCCCVLGIIFYF